MANTNSNDTGLSDDVLYGPSIHDQERKPKVPAAGEDTGSTDQNFVVDGVDTGSPALRAVQNVAVSRGVSNDASWVENLGGIKDTSSLDLSALLDYGWSFDDDGNLVSPGGETINVSDVLTTGVTYDKDAYANILSEYFPDVKLAPEGMSDSDAELLGYLPLGNLKSFIDNKITESENQMEASKLAAGLVFPGLTFMAVLTLAEKRPDVFANELFNIGRNTDTEALLKSLYPDITENEMRNIFGQPAIMSEEEFVNHLNDYVLSLESWLIPGVGTITGMSQVIASGSLGLNPIDAIQLSSNKSQIYVGSEWLKDKYDKYVAYMTDPATMNSLGRSLMAGYGDIQMQIANGAKWLGADGVGTYFSNLASVNQSFGVITNYDGFSWDYLFNREWWATVGARSIASNMPLIAVSVLSGGITAGLVGGAIAGASWAARVSPWVVKLVSGSATGIGAQVLPTVLESGIEAGAAYDQALDDGNTPARAKEIADKVFKDNLLLLGGSNAVEFALSFTPIKNSSKVLAGLSSKGLVKIGKVGGKLTVVGLTEAGQEWYQEIISRQALGQEIKWDDEMELTVALGGLFGVLFGASGMTVSAIQSRVYNSLPSNLKETYAEVKQNAINSGMPESVAVNEALNAVVETKEGAAVVDAVAKQVRVEETEKVLTSENQQSKARNQRVISKLKQDVMDTGIDVAESAESLTPEQQVFNDLSKPAENGQAKSLGAMAWGALFTNKEQRSKAMRIAVVDYIRKYVPKDIQGKFLGDVANAKTWDDFHAISEKVDTHVEAYNKKMLTSKITAEIKKAKPAIKDKVKQGKLTADTQDKLDLITANWNKSRTDARLRIAEAQLAYENGEIDFDVYTDRLDEYSYVGVSEMDNTELSETLDYVKSVIRNGKSERKLMAEEYAKQREANVKEAISVATNGKGVTGEIPSDTVGQKIKDFLRMANNWQVAFTDLMDIISQSEGVERYRGWFNRFADNRISRARNAENNGIKGRSETILSSFSKIFGTANDRARNKLMNEQEHNKIDFGNFINSDGKSIHLILTKAQIFDLYLSFKDPVKVEEFKQNNKYTDDMISAIQSNMTRSEIEWCEWMMDYLDSYYEDINDVYRKIYGINLSRNKNYWPRLRDIEKSQVPEHILQMNDTSNRASTVASSLKEARRNKNPYKVQSAHLKLVNYVSQMEHFMAWSETIKELRSVLSNREVRQAISENYGQEVVSYIERNINNLARGGIEISRRNLRADKIRGNFSVAVLGLKPMIAIKQPIAILGFMTEMPYGDFISGIIDFMKDPIGNYKILYEKSSGLRARYQSGSWERDFAAKYGKTKTVLGTNMPMSDFFLYMIRLADMAGTIPGQWAKYQSELKRGVSEEEAILASEQSVNRTQNTSYLETLSAAQTEGSFLKLLTMFQDQTNKYFRLMGAASRVIMSNKQTPKAKAKALTDLLILWVVLPALFQFMSDGFKWRPERQFRAVVLGPVNYMLVWGQMAQSVVGWAVGEKYAYEPSPVLQIFDDVNYFINDVQKMIGAGQDPYKDITMDDVIRMVEDLAKFVGEGTGIPTPYLIQVEKALRSGKLINLLYSDWALQDPEPDDYSKASELVSGLGQTTLTDDEYAEWQEDILNGIKTDDPPVFTMSNLNSEFNKLFSNMLPDKVMALAGSNGLLIEWASKENAWGEVGILPNVSLIDINTYSSDDTIIQYHKQWLERQKLTKLSDIVAFDKQYPKAYLGNVTESQYNALLQWINISKLPDTKEGNALKEAFLKQHQDITVNPREQYLIEHPDINAKLFIFGQANIYSYKAFKEVMKMVEKHNIPLETLDKAKLAKVPTENVSTLLKAYNLLPAGSKRTALRTKYPVLDAYLVKALGYKPVNNKWLLVTADKIFALDEYNKNR